jgi:hypothetical protein
MDLTGDWIRTSAGDSAEIRISPTRLTDDRVHVSGLALWGEKRPYGPNLGELDFSANIKGRVIHHEEQHTDHVYRITITVHGDVMTVAEENAHGTFGMNVSFAGEYRRAKSGARLARWLRRNWPF